MPSIQTSHPDALKFVDRMQSSRGGDLGPVVTLTEISSALRELHASALEASDQLSLAKDALDAFEAQAARDVSYENQHHLGLGIGAVMPSAREMLQAFIASRNSSSPAMTSSLLRVRVDQARTAFPDAPRAPAADIAGPVGAWTMDVVSRGTVSSTDLVPLLRACFGDAAFSEEERALVARSGWDAVTGLGYHDVAARVGWIAGTFSQGSSPAEMRTIEDGVTELMRALRELAVAGVKFDVSGTTLEWTGYVPASGIGTVPEDSLVPVDALLPPPGAASVDSRLAPQQFLALLDQDHDGFVSGADFNRYLAEQYRPTGYNAYPGHGPHAQISVAGIPFVPGGIKDIHDALCVGASSDITRNVNFRASNFFQTHKGIEEVAPDLKAISSPGIPCAAIDGIYYSGHRPLTPGSDQSGVQGVFKSARGIVFLHENGLVTLKENKQALLGNGSFESIGAPVDVVPVAMRHIVGWGNYTDPFSHGFAIGGSVYQFRRGQMYETASTDCIVRYDVEKGTSEKVVDSIGADPALLGRFGVQPTAVSFTSMAVIQRRREALLFAFDPASNQLTELPPPPTPVVAPVLGNVNGKLWLIGGFLHDPASPQRGTDQFRRVQEYDFETKTWRVLGETPFLIWRDATENFRVIDVEGKPTLAGKHLGSPVAFELVA